jgi:hypothetical protein
VRPLSECVVEARDGIVDRGALHCCCCCSSSSSSCCSTTVGCCLPGIVRLEVRQEASRLQEMDDEDDVSVR